MIGRPVAADRQCRLPSYLDLLAAVLYPSKLVFLLGCHCLHVLELHLCLQGTVPHGFSYATCLLAQAACCGQLDAWTTQAQAIQRGGTAIAAELQNSKPLRDPEAAAHANVEKITEISARLLQLRVCQGFFHMACPSPCACKKAASLSPLPLPLASSPQSCLRILQASASSSCCKGRIIAHMAT